MMNDFAISSNTLLIGMISLCILVISVIFMMRSVLSKRSKTDWSDQQEQDANVAARNKYPAVNAFKWSNTFFMLSLTVALSVVVMAFNWTQYEEAIFIPDTCLDCIPEIEQLPPPTNFPPPPPPPPPPPVVEPVLEDEMEEEDIEFVDLLVEEETVVAPPPKPIAKKTPPPPPTPVIVDKVEDEIFKVVQDMPRFLGCEHLGTKDKIQACADKKLIEFLYRNLKYPAIARENGIEGMCVIQFTVEKNGSVTDAQVVRDIGAGCGNESLRVVKLMETGEPMWRPGRNRAKPVRVRFTLPVKFQLQ